MLPDFVSNVRRFLHGDWSNAGMIVRYWACAKPTAAEIAAVRAELSNTSPDSLLVKGLLLYYNVETSSDSKDDALSCLTRVAVVPRAFALQMLGFLYEYGEITQLDYAKLFVLYEKILSGSEMLATERALAANNLGHLYECGFGVVRDYAMAKKYYAMASVLGEVAALTNLGVMYEYGAGVGIDYGLARKHYELAAQSAEFRALERLGNLYERGLGVVQNYRTAAKYYQDAAQRGSLEALNRLGFFYENGLGVPREFPLAEEYYRKAVNMNDPHAAARLVELYSGASAWYTSSLLVELDLFAKNTMRQREINYLTAKVLAGNFGDLCPANNHFLAMNAYCATIKVFAHLLRTVDYLVERRRQNEELDYQVRINDFWNIINCGEQNKSALAKYLAQYRFIKRFFHSNNYYHLRSTLENLLSTASAEECGHALQLYRQYLKYRKNGLTTSLERDVVYKLSDIQMRPYSIKDGLPVYWKTSCCFFGDSDSRDSSPEASPKTIEMKPMV